MKRSTAFVMVGAPGSGKSTHAKRIAAVEKATIISGDDIRAELFGSSSVQGEWSQIWFRIDELVADLAPGSVIVDGTHYRRDYRAETVILLRSYGYERIEAVVVDAPLIRCLERNASRSRHVPEHVIRKMHTELQDSLKDICLEDFNRVNFVF
jgi:predicted kinase